MDYADPANRRLRDEPTLPLSPEEAAIAAKLCQEQVLVQLISKLTLTGKAFAQSPDRNDQRN